MALTPAQLDKLPDSMIQLMSELQDEIISDVCRRIKKTNLLTPTAEWQLVKANQLTLSSQEVKRRIAQKLKISERSVKELYTDAVRTAIREDEKIYKFAMADGILSGDYREKLTNYTRSVAFSNALKKGLKNTNGLMRNLTNSAAAAANRQLSDALDLAYLEVASGAFTTQEAVFKAVKKLGADGIKCVSYKSGRTDQLDVAVRRAIVTGIGKTCGDMQLGLAHEMDCQLVEVSSHLGARPSHAEWQGQIYSLVKGHPKYPYFYDATGYGTGDGLCGWNCRHSFFPYFEGLSRPTNEPNFSRAENAQVYADTQRQRAYERAIRKSKRELAALDGARSAENDPAAKARYDSEFARKSAVLKRREAALAEHLKSTGLLPDNSRVRVDGFGRSVSQKAVHAAKRYAAGKTNINSGSNNSRPYYPANADFLNSTAFKKQFEGLFNPKLDKAVCKYSQLAVVENDNKPSETIYLLSESGRKLQKLTKKHYSDSGDIGGTLLAEKRKFILVHNHPNNTPLSLSDIMALNDVDNMKAVISVGHDGKICVVSIGNGKRVVSDRDYNFFESAYARNVNRYGCTNDAIENFCKEVGWNYGK